MHIIILRESLTAATEMGKADVISNSKPQPSTVPEHEQLLQNAKSIVPNWPAYVPATHGSIPQTFNLLFDMLGDSQQITLNEKPTFISKELKSDDPSKDKIKSFHANPPKRAPHNLGFRNNGGPSKESNYILVDSSVQHEQDPYKPIVIFPANARKRHGGRQTGRKSIRLSGRLNYENVVHDALKKMSTLTKKANDLVSSQESNSQSKLPVISSVDNLVPTSPDDSPSYDDLPSPTSDDVQAPSFSLKRPLQGSHNSTTVNKTHPKGQKKIIRNKLHTPGTIICFYCISSGKKVNTFYRNQKDLHVHIKRSHNKNAIVCAQCYISNNTLIKQFNNEAGLRQHIATYHKITPNINFSNITPQLNALLGDSQNLQQLSTQGNKPGLQNLAKFKLNKLSLSKRKLSANELLQEETIKLNKKAKLQNVTKTWKVCLTIIHSNDTMSVCKECKLNVHKHCTRSENICKDCELAMILISL